MADIAPWDYLPYCNLPVQAYVTVPDVTPGAKLCSYDPMRIALIIGPRGNINISLDSTFDSGSGGMPLTNSVNPFVMTFGEHRSLVNQAWFGFSSSGGAVVTTVVTVSMIDWPLEGHGVEERLRRMNTVPKRPPNKIPATPGANGKRGILDYWLSLIRGK